MVRETRPHGKVPQASNPSRDSLSPSRERARRQGSFGRLRAAALGDARGLADGALYELPSQRPSALAPQAGFEPATNRLTADRSTTELLRSIQENSPAPIIVYHPSPPHSRWWKRPNARDSADCSPNRKSLRHSRSLLVVVRHERTRNQQIPLRHSAATTSFYPPSRHSPGHHVILPAITSFPWPSRHSTRHHVIPRPPRHSPATTSFYPPSRHSRVGGNLAVSTRNAFIRIPAPRQTKLNPYAVCLCYDRWPIERRRLPNIDSKL